MILWGEVRELGKANGQENKRQIGAQHEEMSLMHGALSDGRDFCFRRVRIRFPGLSKSGHAFYREG